MDIVELKKKTEQELRSLLVELAEELREFRFKIASGDIKKVHEVRVVRKTIARILTVLNAPKKAA